MFTIFPSYFSPRFYAWLFKLLLVLVAVSRALLFFNVLLLGPSGVPSLGGRDLCPAWLPGTPWSEGWVAGSLVVSLKLLVACCCGAVEGGASLVMIATFSLFVRSCPVCFCTLRFQIPWW